MTRTRTALVIGGGVAGCSVAMALQKAGIEPLVCEAHTGTAEGTGIFLTLATNGIDALRALDTDGPVLTAGFPTPGIVLRSGTGKRLGTVRTGGTLPDGTLSHTIRRADLYRVLHDEAASRGVVVRQGARLVHAEEAGDGVTARFEDGTEETADVLIGCDGVHSTVRSLIDRGAPRPTYAGLVTTGGYARGVDLDTEPGTYEMIFGRRAFFGHVTAPDGEVWWFVNLPRQPEPARGELTSVSAGQLRDSLRRAYSDDAGPAVRLIDSATELPPMTPIHSVPHLPRWHSRRMVVIGDAAHAPSPTSGQGASLAIEDAVILAQHLRDVPEPQEAFSRFEALRRPRAERIIKAAARFNSNKAAGPVGRVLRDALLPTVIRLTANNTALADMFDHHVEWDASTTGAGR